MLLILFVGMILNGNESNILTGGNMDKIDKILRYDPIAETEKITGKGHWSNFSEDDNMLALLMNIQHANKKQIY